MLKKYESLFKESQNIGIIKYNELNDAFPVLAKEYKEIFSNSRPDIKVKVSTTYEFSSAYGEGYKNYHVLYKDCKVKTIEGSWGGFNPNVKLGSESHLADSNKIVNLKPGEMGMCCTIGPAKVCVLTVHPDNVAKLLANKEAEDLNIIEKAVLKIMYKLISSARQSALEDVLDLSEFAIGNYISEDVYRNSSISSDIKNKINHVKQEYYSKYGKRISDIWKGIMSELAKKGYVKVNASGSAQLTSKGKNYTFKG